MDRQSTVTATTNQSGGLVNTYRYDPWGNSIGTTGTVYNEYRYAGTYREPDLGMYQMGARYYGAGLGRFTQLDPRGSSIFEANRYAYAGCNPANYTDPTGVSDEYLNQYSCAAAVASLIYTVVGTVGIFVALTNPVLGAALAVVGGLGGTAYSYLSLQATLENHPTETQALANQFVFYSGLIPGVELVAASPALLLAAVLCKSE